MKKYLFLAAAVVATSFTAIGCSDRTTDVVHQETLAVYPKKRDITGTFTATGNFTISQSINIPSTDVVLVYRNINSNSAAPAVWQLLPKTEFLSNNRELDYNFLFDSSRIEIFTEANFDQKTMAPAEVGKYLTNQQFRLVLVPASEAKNANLDYSNYDQVIKYVDGLN